MQSRAHCPPAVLLSLFHGALLKHLCLLLVRQNKQRRAELEQWLEKSTNPRQDMSAWASRPDQVLWKGWVNEVRGRKMNVSRGRAGRGGWGGVGGGAGTSWDQRCELRADRAASLNLVYHIRHGNITSIFFSLQDQSLHNPSKQLWNNSLFALCGLGEGGGGVYSVFAGSTGSSLLFGSVKVETIETILSVSGKLTHPPTTTTTASLICFSSASPPHSGELTGLTFNFNFICISQHTLSYKALHRARSRPDFITARRSTEQELGDRVEEKLNRKKAPTELDSNCVCEENEWGRTWRDHEQKYILLTAHCEHSNSCR